MSTARDPDEYYEAFGAWRAHSHGRRRERLLPLLEGRVLDVGCGDGRVLLEALGERAVGVDPDAAMLAAARRRAPASGLARATGEALPLGDATFDRVVISHALWLSERPLACLAEAARVLRGGGELVVVSNHPRYFVLRGALLAMRRLAGRPHHEPPPGLHRAREIRDAVSSVGLEVTAFESFMLVPLPGFAALDRTPFGALGYSFLLRARKPEPRRP